MLLNFGNYFKGYSHHTGLLRFLCEPLGTVQVIINNNIPVVHRIDKQYKNTDVQ